jgi:hypothetical protein
MKKTTLRFVIATPVALALSSAVAQLEVGGDLLSNCAQIDSLSKAGDYAQARDKARLCLEGLEQKVQGEVGTFFRSEIAGWTRTSLENESALGFANVSATYQKGETYATVSLTGGEGGGDGGLGSLLSGFARLGLEEAAGREVKVAGLAGTVQPDGTITVTLEDGSFLSFVSTSFGDPDTALAGIGDLVNAFPVAEINQTLKSE